MFGGSPLCLRLRRALRGVLTQLVFRVLILGAGLYLVDVGSDLAVTWKFYQVYSSSLHQAGNTTITTWYGYVDEASFKELFFNYALVSACIMCLPGLLTATQSLLRGKMDFGLGRPVQMRTWIHWALAPCYLAVMSVWWLVIPVVKYMTVAKHLAEEYRGLCEYDPEIVREAVESKQMEGLSEASLQFALQLAILIDVDVKSKIYKSYFPPAEGLIRWISFVLLPSSAVSISKTVAVSQAEQVSKVGRLREAPWPYYLSFAAWSAWQVLIKLVLIPRYGSAFSMLHLGLMVGLAFAADLFARWSTFGWYPLMPSHSLLSIVIPIDFIAERRTSTKSYLVKSTSLQFVIANCFSSVTCWSYGCDGKDHFMGLFDINILILVNVILMMGFVSWGLDPMYASRNTAHPSMSSPETRQGTYPFGALKTSPQVKRLIEEGHFYSHARLLKMQTTCYRCGLTVRHWERASGAAETPPKLHHGDCDVASLLRRPGKTGELSTDSRGEQRASWREKLVRTIGRLGGFLLVADVSCAAVTALTTRTLVFLVQEDSRRDDFFGFNLFLAGTALAVSLVWNLFATFTFGEEAIAMKKLLALAAVQVFTWRTPYAPTWFKLVLFSYLPNLVLVCFIWTEVYVG